MPAEWLWTACIAGGLALFLGGVELLSRFNPGSIAVASEEEDDDEGSSFVAEDDF